MAIVGTLRLCLLSPFWLLTGAAMWWKCNDIPWSSSCLEKNVPETGAGRR